MDRSDVLHDVGAAGALEYNISGVSHVRLYFESVTGTVLYLCVFAGYFGRIRYSTQCYKTGRGGPRGEGIGARKRRVTGVS